MGAHGRETDRFEGSVKCAGGTGICACGQPVNECPSATLFSQPKGITVHQTMLLRKKGFHCFITFRSNLITVKSNVSKHTLTKHKVNEIEPNKVQDFIRVICNVIIQMTTITVENPKIHC